MALTNAQYDEIMRGYDKRQLQNKYIHDKRIEEAYRKAPRLREIDSEIASASVRQAYKLSSLAGPLRWCPSTSSAW